MPHHKSEQPTCTDDAGVAPIFLTPGQQGIWVQDSLGVGSAYNVAFAYRLGRGLDSGRLITAVESVLGAHAALRTRIRLHEGDPTATISTPGTGVEVTRQRVKADEAPEVLLRSWQEPFDLSGDLPARALLLDLGDHHVLSITVHHIVFDDWSMGIVLDEIAACYQFGPRAAPDPDDLRLSQHLASWRSEISAAGSVRERTLRKRAALLADTPERLDLPRPLSDHVAADGRQGASQCVIVDSPTAQAIRALAAENGCTEYVVYLTAWATLVSIYAQNSDVAIGTPFAQRSRPGAEDLVGYFLDSLVLRQRIDETATFAETVSVMRDTFFEAVDDSSFVSYEDVVREISGRDPNAPLFTTWFAWQRGDDDLHLEGVDVERIEVPVSSAKFDLALFVTHDDQPRLDLEHALSAYDGATARSILQHYVHLLKQVSHQPGIRLGDIDMVTRAELENLREWGRGPSPIPQSPALHVDTLIRAQADAHPDAPAVLHDDSTVTYSALAKRAAQWTDALREHGARPGQVIGIAMDRSPELVAVILGVLGAGAGYVALDLSDPIERLRYMVADSSVRLVVSDSLTGSVNGLDFQLLNPIDLIEQEPSGQVVERPQAESTLAYVTYTSGSTGRPKGIRMTHGSLENLLQWQRETYPNVTLGTRTLQFASLGFDVSAQEIFGTLQTGGTLVMISKDQRDEVHNIMRIVRDTRVERLFMPAPALLEAVVSAVAGELQLRDLRVVVSGSEQLVVTDALRAFFTACAPAARLFNEYGPSETHVATMYAADSDPTIWPTWMPIGAPIGATEVRVLDGQGRCTPPGSVGEIYLCGAGLSQGYTGMPAETAAAFIPDAHGSAPGARAYRTGDLARYDADGVLQYLGRRDSQVKVRGFRIELEEVRAVLDSAPGVAQAFVTIDGRQDKTRLVGYWLRDADSDITETSLRAFLADRLPNYMVPTALREVEHFPLTRNGKVDNAALTAEWQLTDKDRHGHPEDEQSREVDPLTAAVASTMAEVLECEQLKPSDDFFSLGGNSLLANRLVWMLGASKVAHVTLRAVMEGRTPRSIAATSSPITARSDSTDAAPNRDTQQTRQRLEDLMESLEDE